VIAQIRSVGQLEVWPVDFPHSSEVGRSASDLGTVKTFLGVRSIAKWFALGLPAAAQSIRLVERVLFAYDIALRISLNIRANGQFGEGDPS
jgi:hypothetical protein